MQGHKKRFRKSLWLRMAFNGEWGTETPIALTTTTTFTTTTALSTTTPLSTTTFSTTQPVWTTTSDCAWMNNCYDGKCCSFCTTGAHTPGINIYQGRCCARFNCCKNGTFESNVPC